MSIIRGALAGLGAGLMGAGEMYMKHGIQTKQNEQAAQLEMEMAQKKAEILEHAQRNMEQFKMRLMDEDRTARMGRIRSAAESNVGQLPEGEREGAIAKAMMDPRTAVQAGEYDLAKVLDGLSSNKPVELGYGSKLVDPGTRETLADNNSDQRAAYDALRAKLTGQRRSGSGGKKEADIDPDKIYEGAGKFYKDREFIDPLTGEEDVAGKQLRIEAVFQTRKDMQDANSDISYVEASRLAEPDIKKYDKEATAAAKVKAARLIKEGKDVGDMTEDELASRLRASYLTPDRFKSWLEDGKPSFAETEAKTEPKAKAKEEERPLINSNRPTSGTTNFDLKSYSPWAKR